MIADTIEMVGLIYATPANSIADTCGYLQVFFC
jgi:hypothetical protein